MPALGARILVHAHVFYQNMWAELALKLQSLAGYAFDLHLTVPQEDEEFKREVLAAYPHASITLVENRGFDVLPFVQLIQQLDMNQYDYVVKIHTKRDIYQCKINGVYLKGADWRNAALSFLSSPESFKNCIEHFESNPSCGIIASRRITAKISKYSSKLTRKRFAAFLHENKLARITKAQFVAGTMFIARAKILKQLDLVLLSDFESCIEHDGLFAHVVERYLGYIAYAQGMSIQDASLKGTANLAYHAEHLWKGVICPSVYSAGITNKNRLFVKMLKIPVPYRVSEMIVPRYKMRLLKDKQKRMQAVRRSNRRKS